MRKLILLCLTMVITHSLVFASSMSPGNWRWRTSTSYDINQTWAANINTPIYKNDNTPIVLRMGIYSESISGTGSGTLQYAVVDANGGRNSGGRFYFDNSNFPSYEWVTVGAPGAHWEMGGETPYLFNGQYTLMALGHVAGRSEPYYDGRSFTTTNGGIPY